MRRHLPKPLHPGVLHRHIRIQALGHRMGNHCLALFLKQIYQALLFADQGVDFGGFVTKKFAYLHLFSELWYCKVKLCKVRVPKRLTIPNQIACSLERTNKWSTFK